MAGEDYRELGEAAWAWVMGEVRGDEGPWLPEVVTDDGPAGGPAADRDSLYAGIGGLAPVLAEIGQYRALTDAEEALASAIAERIVRLVPARLEPSLYDGLGGDVMALRMLAPGSEQTAIARLAELMTPAGWNTTLRIKPDSVAPVTDVLSGGAGVVMAAIWAGGEHAASIAGTGGEALLRAADQAGDNLDWVTVPGSVSRTPNFSHGTAGVAAALAVAGAALGRADFTAAAMAGARHLLAVGARGDEGFIVPHTLPYSARDVDPVTYNWCHGPAGTSQLFAALAEAGVEEIAGLPVTWLRQRCLDSVLSSGVPRRLRPGFWDNDGRCCGTAGVGDVLLDAAQDCDDARRAGTLLQGASAMAAALAERAIRDEAGARWRFTEHRRDPPLLPPGTSWMQGAAGIAAFLLRIARVLDGGLGAPVVDRPDQWWAVPGSLRSSGAGSHLPSEHLCGRNS
ncbi:MAG TPA: lanthionine synthetase LanC family protein [Streptosporangiaceae bacterium]|nr:lanthionine synthetase LanC family protein [Streptosporangiaceae bacterium]